MDQALKDRLIATLGDESKDFTDEQFLSAAATFMEDAAEYNHELSAANKDLTDERKTLQDKVTELSAAKPAETIELSAGTKKLVTTNLGLRIDAIAKDHGWSSADVAEAKALFGTDTLIGLSASGVEGDDDTAEKLLGLLAKRPVAGLKTGTELSGAQTTDSVVTLSRNGSDTDAPPASADNPLLNTANRLAGK